MSLNAGNDNEREALMGEEGGKILAYSYAKNFKRQALGVAVIIGNHTCINVPLPE